MSFLPPAPFHPPPAPESWQHLQAGLWRRDRPILLGTIVAEVRYNALWAAYSVRVELFYDQPGLVGHQGDLHHQPLVGTLADAWDLADLWTQEIADHYRDWPIPAWLDPRP